MGKGGCPLLSAAAGAAIATAAQREKVVKARGGGLEGARGEKQRGGEEKVEERREEGWKGERRTRGRGGTMVRGQRGA